MIELDDCTIAIEALECITQYLDSISEAPDYDYSAAISKISGIVMFAHHLSLKSHGLSIVKSLQDFREENES